jgi:hypothetical protein
MSAADTNGIPLFALEGLLLTRRGGSLWIEGDSAPLSRETARIISCSVTNEDEEGVVVATGSAKYLERSDAPLKIVTAEDAPIPGVSIGGWAF